MTKKAAIQVVSIVFLAGILIRLPNFQRPLSKHHEFMNALILINMESWRQGGGGSHFSYVPVMNFQNQGDKYYDSSVYVNRNHDRWYLSLGPGWYMIPYFIYQLLHLPAVPVYLRILNLLSGFLSAILFFRLCEYLVPPGAPRRYLQITLASCLFIFSPAMLWYTGNAYAHTALVLPFVIGFLILVFSMTRGPEKSSKSRLTILFVLILLLIYIDWLVLFVASASCLYLLSKRKPDKFSYWLVAAILGSCATGITLLFFQFASQDGPDAVLAYWKSRFLFRSFANQEVSYPRMAFHLVFFHGLTAYLPQLLLIGACTLWAWYKKIRFTFRDEERFLLLTYGLAVLFYNAVFIEWSYEHEFSLVPWSPVLAYFGGKWVVELSQGRSRIFFFSGCYLVFTVFQYYYINRPGKVSRDGMPYNTFQISGDHIRNIPPDYKIYAAIGKPAPMIEYYAGRNISPVLSLEAARQDMKTSGITRAVWVEQDQYNLKTITVIR